MKVHNKYSSLIWKLILRCWSRLEAIIYYCAWSTIQQPLQQLPVCFSIILYVTEAEINEFRKIYQDSIQCTCNRLVLWIKIILRLFFPSHTLFYVQITYSICYMSYLQCLEATSFWMLKNSFSSLDLVQFESKFLWSDESFWCLFH